MSVYDPEECSCDCHENEYVMHMMPCCEQCPHCKKNIQYSIDEHVKECLQRREEIMKRFHEIGDQLDADKKKKTKKTKRSKDIK